MWFNIYYLDASPAECGAAMTDEHVKAQCLQLGVLLSTIHRGFTPTGKIDSLQTYRIDQYQSDHYCEWVKKSAENYKWLFNLFSILCDEHAYRFKKKHPSASLLPFVAADPCNGFANRVFAEIRRSEVFSAPPCRTRDKYFMSHSNKKITPSKPDFSCVNTYRHWYIEEILPGAKMTGRSLPTWAARYFETSEEVLAHATGF